jgi:hypothetical protein
MQQKKQGTDQALTAHRCGGPNVVACFQKSTPDDWCFEFRVCWRTFRLESRRAHLAANNGLGLFISLPVHSDGLGALSNKDSALEKVKKALSKLY